MNMHAMKRYGAMVVMALCIGTMTLSGVLAADSVTVNEQSGAEYNTGLAAFRQNQYDEALAHFISAFELDGRNVEALFAQGLARNNLGRYAEAADTFAAVLERDPSHGKALKMHPTALLKAGETNAALAAYDAGIEHMPDDHYFHYGKAVVYITMGESVQAVDSLWRTVALQPDNIRYRSMLAQVLVEAGHHKEAYVQAEKILRQDPAHARALVISGDFKRTNDQLHAALEDYRAAAKNIDTKAYAEHFIEAINQTLEEREIEREYQQRIQAEQHE